jgi:hypothetical protein
MLTFDLWVSFSFRVYIQADYDVLRESLFDTWLFFNLAQVNFLPITESHVAIWLFPISSKAEFLHVIYNVHTYTYMHYDLCTCDKYVRVIIYTHNNLHCYYDNNLLIYK